MQTPNTYIERTDAFMAPLAHLPGVEVYRVGGSVRDEILGRPIKDADYMVRGMGLRQLGDKLRDQSSLVKPLKDRKARPLGWRVGLRGVGAIEITLPRKEVSTGPGHRDFDIVLDPHLSLETDAERRDFTFNALYKGIEPQGWTTSMVLPDGRALTNVVDPTGRGLYDLSRMLVCTTHSASFRDDPLRILRALRFVSTLGYDLAQVTYAELADHFKAVSGLTASGHTSGTVFEEFSKLLMGAHAVKALRIARDTGVLGTVFPELKPMFGFEQSSRYHDMTTDDHTFAALETAVKIDAPLTVRWALLFHDSGKPESAWIGPDNQMHYYKSMRADQDVNGDWVPSGTEDHEVVGARKWVAAANRMGVDKKTREEVNRIILEHMITVQPRNLGVKVRRNRVRLGDDLLRKIHMHRMCDLTGKGTSNRGHLVAMAQQEDERARSEFAGVPCKIGHLEITGHDVASLKGVSSGPMVGKILAAVLDEVACDPSELKLTREWQESAAERLANKASQ